MTILDEILAFRHDMAALNVPGSLHILITLNPQALRDAMMEIRGYGGPAMCCFESICGYPYEVKGPSTQTEPWIAWVESGNERRQVDRLRKGLLNIGTDERQEETIRGYLSEHNRLCDELNRARRDHDPFTTLAAEQAVRYQQAAIDEMFNEYKIPFAVTILSSSVIHAVAHSRRQCDDLVQHRMMNAGYLVVAASALLPHKTQVPL